MQLNMHILYTNFTFCWLFCLILTSVISPNPYLKMESALSKETRTISNSSTWPLNVTRYLCNGDIYRDDLQRRSCIDALVTISRNREVVTFGPRSAHMPFHVELPFRWISGTSEPAIDLPVLAANQWHCAPRRWSLCLRHLYCFR